jgi:hypothetical protein
MVFTFLSSAIKLLEGLAAAPGERSSKFLLPLPTYYHPENSISSTGWNPVYLYRKIHVKISSVYDQCLLLILGKPPLVLLGV